MSTSSFPLYLPLFPSTLYELTITPLTTKLPLPLPISPSSLFHLLPSLSPIYPTVLPPKTIHSLTQSTLSTLTTSDSPVLISSAETTSLLLSVSRYPHTPSAFLSSSSPLPKPPSSNNTLSPPTTVHSHPFPDFTPHYSSSPHSPSTLSWTLLDHSFGGKFVPLQRLSSPKTHNILPSFLN